MSKKFYRANKDFIYGQDAYKESSVYYLHLTAVETISRIYGQGVLTEQTNITAGEAPVTQADVVYDMKLADEVSQALADGTSAAEYKALYARVLALGGHDEQPHKKVKDNKEALKKWIVEIQEEFVDK